MIPDKNKNWISGNNKKFRQLIDNLWVLTVILKAWGWSKAQEPSKVRTLLKARSIFWSHFRSLLDSERLHFISFCHTCFDDFFCTQFAPLVLCAKKTWAQLQGASKKSSQLLKLYLSAKLFHFSQDRIYRGLGTYYIVQCVLMSRHLIVVSASIAKVFSLNMAWMNN